MKFKNLFFILSLIALPSYAFSEDSSESADTKSSIFDEVVVTARKREESAQSVPIPISALGGDQMEARNITEIADVTKLTPNLNFSAQGINSTVTNVFLRGIGQSNWSETQDPKIGIYIDGVYWRIIKIVDYQPNKNQSTKVELIEYPQLGTFAATAPAYNGYTNPWGGWNPDTGSHTGEPDNEL